MDNFNYKKYLAEGKLNEKMFNVATTKKIAQAVADAFTADDELDLKYVVNPRIDPSSFDLDVEAGPNTPGPEWRDKNGFSIDNYLGEFAGGSFYIDNGIVYNAAMRNAPVAKVSEEGEVEMISAADSRAAIGMEENKEETKSNKMKKSELKEMIKSAFLNETEEKVEEGQLVIGNAKDIQRIVDALNQLKDNAYNVLGDDIFFNGLDNVISRAEELMMNAPLSEAEGDEEEITVDDTEEIDVDTDAETADAGEVDIKMGDDEGLKGPLKKIDNNLEAAIEAARELGDEKLIDQIGNTITFFTRTHVVGKAEVAEADIDVDSPAEEAEIGMELNESINRMKKLAGLIK
jgi:hypothetical protein